MGGLADFDIINNTGKTESEIQEEIFPIVMGTTQNLEMKSPLSGKSIKTPYSSGDFILTTNPVQVKGIPSTAGKTNKKYSAQDAYEAGFDPAVNNAKWAWQSPSAPNTRDESIPELVKKTGLIQFNQYYYKNYSIRNLSSKTRITGFYSTGDEKIKHGDGSTVELSKMFPTLPNIQGNPFEQESYRSTDSIGFKPPFISDVYGNKPYFCDWLAIYLYCSTLARPSKKGFIEILGATEDDFIENFYHAVVRTNRAGGPNDPRFKDFQDSADVGTSEDPDGYIAEASEYRQASAEIFGICKITYQIYPNTSRYI